MTVRPPRGITPKITNIWKDSPAAALDYEIAQEKASTLGRLGRALEAALAALTAFDAQEREHTPEIRHERRDLVAEAGHALWLFVVQREALGLRDTRQLMRDYRVPAEVQARMGLRPATTPGRPAAKRGA
jgi:cation diffusion facilitator CzcD-associated flavoprotein CzcO